MTSGGNMFHEAGYAGLPEACHPIGGDLDKKVDIRVGGQNKILHAGGEALIDRPLGISGTLLLEKTHT